MTPYFKDLHDAVQSHGGFFNAHLHLDRAGTYHPTVALLEAKGVADGTVLSLAGKHAVIPSIHASECYVPDKLYARVAPYLDEMIAVGTRRADTVVDTTADGVGTRALETFARLRDDYADRLDLRIGAYSPLGFRDDEPERWELVEKAAEWADLIGLLPERDDHADYPDHIGFGESCRRGLHLARRLGKPIHIHVDQANHQYETASETVLEIARDMGFDRSGADEPLIWLIHVISPSTYDEPRFAALAKGLGELNIGVICCPAAAISMRQYRPLKSPTYNSIARVLDLVMAGAHVRIGSDNVCDITSPMGTPNLMDEVRVLGDAMRYYDIDFLARIAAGKRIDDEGLARLRAHLDMDRDYVAAVTKRVTGG